MTELKTFFVGLKVEMEFEGHDIPDEEILLAPIKKFVKDHIKCYKKTTRVTSVDSTVREVFDEEEEKEDEF
jgi:hypothetical protein